MAKHRTNKKKKRLKFIINSFLILLFVILIMLAFYYYQYGKPLEYIKEITINSGDKIPTLEKYLTKDEINKIDNPNIVWNDIDKEDDIIYTPGTYFGIIKYHNQEINLKLNVIDTLPPEIEGTKNIEIYKDESVDLLKDIKVIDNSKEIITPTISGEYNVSKVGTYNLKYIATDSSQNQEEIEFKLIVKEKPSTIIGKTSKGFTIEKKNGIIYVNNILIANKTYALPSTYAPGKLTNETNQAFNKMKDDAATEGLNLYVKSGYRSYYDQRYIYNNYVKEDGQANADTYSARAGHSEHQTGLAFDINTISISFADTNEGKWVNENCYKYGFIIRYPMEKEHITGYQYEPWHLRYVGVDLAKELYNNGTWITLEEYLGITSKYQ